MKTNDGSKKSAIGRVANNGDCVLRPLSSQEPTAWGIKPLNKEQRFAMELLLDDRVDLVTLVGTAGTGKTLITLATGLRRTFDDETLILENFRTIKDREINFFGGLFNCLKIRYFSQII